MKRIIELYCSIVRFFELRIEVHVQDLVLFSLNKTLRQSFAVVIGTTIPIAVIAGIVIDGNNNTGVDGVDDYQHQHYVDDDEDFFLEQ
ncbi:hypothetical protein DERF_010377 [Dermatophagoides farinae]|uniref:Uncharacterized protein n=1 Tax=Dermatophagoides farinae TaxID=6954 RepID=A0A922L6U3_DERFA|nr:hypothetical protein DERF_010377 [Dermatophagoides farinae]